MNNELAVFHILHQSYNKHKALYELNIQTEKDLMSCVKQSLI